MRVLITGSSGQIGTNVGLELLNRGDTVQGIDIRDNAWTDEIPTIKADLTQCTDGSLPVVGDFDVVLHLAAHAKVHELVEHPQRSFENVAMLRSALEYARRTQTPFVFGSSREVYGDILHHVTEESQADFVVAESPYSASKISGEAFVYSYHECYQLPHLVFRFSNVYGRYDCDLERMERVIPLFARKIFHNEPVTVFGREKVFDFTYVDDCAAGIICGLDALVARTIDKQTINLAYGQGATLLDVVNLIALTLDREPEVHYAPARAGEVMRYVAELKRAREILNYNPETPLSAGIPRAVRWQREAGYLQ